MAERDARIRRLEHAQLDLRLRRARLEVSLLEAERIASQERMKESLLRIKSLSSSTSSTPSSIPTIGTSSLLYLPGTPTSPPTAVAHQPASKGLRVNRPDTSRKRSLWMTYIYSLLAAHVLVCTAYYWLIIILYATDQWCDANLDSTSFWISKKKLILRFLL